MANLKTTRVRPRSKAQAFVEFAIIVPLLLVALTGIIEFGYAFYTWSAVSEVARIATRYAVTGDLDTQYCAPAGAVLGLAADDLLDGVVDCQVPATRSDGTDVANFETETSALQDWARLPSIRDAGMHGGSAGLLFNPAVSGDYVQFLSHPFVRDGTLTDAGFHTDYRGNPTMNGFISINVCSNRSNVAFDPMSHYYGNPSGDTRYLGVCVVTDNTVSPAVQHYLDDAGGPGDRIRVTVTYNHPLIIPFFSALWQHLKISTTQDAIVERFRTSRLAGLSGGISVLSTWTLTPSVTNPPTETSTPPPPTKTNTPTITITSSPTPQPCPDIADGTGLRVNYYAYVGNASTNPWDNLVYSGIDSTVYFNWGSSSPNPSVPVDNFRGRWEGWVYPPYPGSYTFQTYSDDGVALWINGGSVISNWTDHGSTLNTGTVTLACQKTPIKLEYYENGGGALIQLGWVNGNIGTMMPIDTKYLYPLAVVPIPTSTYLTPTPTRTFTSSATNTPKATNTPRPPTNTFTATVPSHTPTKTLVQPATDTPIPPTASFTPSPTKTNTPKPTCGIGADAGGCTPIP